MRTKVLTSELFVALVIVFVCSALMGCSSVSLVGFFRFWGSAEPGGGLSAKDIERMGFQMRPAKGNAEAHYNLGCYYQERDRHREAIEELQKAVSIDQGNVKALNRLGVSYDEMKEFPKAVAAYQAAIRIDPAADYTYNNLALSYRLQGRFEESIDTFKKALVINNQSIRIHNNLGLVYVMIGKTELARREFEQATALAEAETSPRQDIRKRHAAGAATAGSVQLKPAEDRFRRADITTLSPPQPTAEMVDVKKRAEVNTNGVAEFEEQVGTRAIKTVEIERPMETEKTAAKAGLVRTSLISSIKPMSVMLEKKAQSSHSRSGIVKPFDPAKFCAEMAESIVKIRPVVLIPLQKFETDPVVKAWL